MTRCAALALLLLVAACGKTSMPGGSAAPPASTAPATVAAGGPGTDSVATTEPDTTEPDTTEPATTAPDTTTTSGPAGGTGTGTVTRASFDAAGNAICKHYNALNDALPQPPKSVAGQATTQAQLLQLATYVASSEALEDAETKALRALPHPSADSAAFTNVLNMQAAAAALEVRIVADLRSGNTTDALTGIDQVQATGTAVNAPFDALGLRSCGSGAT